MGVFKRFFTAEIARKYYNRFLDNMKSVGVDALLDSRAATRVQAVILAVVIVVAALGAVAAYILISGEDQPSETIKIGILADLDVASGISLMQAAELAAEEINAEGGVLGRQIVIVGEDSDVDSSPDSTTAQLALNRLVFVDEADFVIVGGGEDLIIDAGVQYKKILFGVSSPAEDLTQRVIEDYDNYKYFFRLRMNETTFGTVFCDTILHLREITGFRKVAYLARDTRQTRLIMDALDSLPETSDVEIVYSGTHPKDTMDFASYLAEAEAAGAEIMVPLEVGKEGVALAYEWYMRQSPMVLWGLNPYLAGYEVWEGSDGRVKSMSLAVTSPLSLGYEVTSKTSATQEAYQNRWGEPAGTNAIAVYDCIRFLLFDALERAQTIETEAVIKALEESEIENSLEENFRFTSSHDHLHVPGESGMVFQWQTDGKMAIVYPKKDDG